MEKDKVKDITYSLTKAGLGSIPVVGAAASELLGLIVTPPLEKRRSEWMLEVGERLKMLEETKGILLESLKENDTFIDIVIQTTQLANKTSEEEKIKIYQNVIFNSLENHNPELAEIQIFLHLVESFTVWHIKLLVLFDNPKKWLITNGITPPELMMGSMFSVVDEAYPELKPKQKFCNLIWSDLYRAGLVNTDSLSGMMSGNGIYAKRTTEFGDKFLDFIKTK
ncbi:hypothetical protein [uncultured Draconibacterium sp.]|uniref:hypothetical protein n=1 Tax=uncultured Draconibacterium sp. TaxID=1573823 RepID=UPI0032180D28